MFDIYDYLHYFIILQTIQYQFWLMQIDSPVFFMSYETDSLASPELILEMYTFHMWYGRIVSSLGYSPLIPCVYIPVFW